MSVRHARCETCGHQLSAHAVRSGLCGAEGCQCEGFTWPGLERASLAPLDDDHGGSRANLVQRLFSLADRLELTSREELSTLVTMNERVSDGLTAHLAAEDVYGDVFKVVAVGLAFLDHRDRQHAEAVKHS